MATATPPRTHVWLRKEPVPGRVYGTYWRFAAERQLIFHRRAAGVPPPWTTDPVLSTYRFTNAYRASDRVSQYLINVVIPGSQPDARDLFFRVLLFKIFNRTSTWRFLEGELGPLHVDVFDVQQFREALTRRLMTGARLYSAAYIMPMPRCSEAASFKHEAHLLLLAAMLRDNLPEGIAAASSMRSVYEMLAGYPSLGPFLAFQYTIDLNYSSLTHFDEMEFVVAGPGARSGIAKCFSDTAGWSDADIVRWITERAESEFAALELNFMDLWGRPLHLIDCQNLLCEVDKYARVAHPEVIAGSARTRIKQTYRQDPAPLTYGFPPDWGLKPRVCSSISASAGNGQLVLDCAVR
jgi:hypothetical protein